MTLFCWLFMWILSHGGWPSMLAQICEWNPHNIPKSTGTQTQGSLPLNLTSAPVGFGRFSEVWRSHALWSGPLSHIEPRGPNVTTQICAHFRAGTETRGIVLASAVWGSSGYGSRLFHCPCSLTGLILPTGHSPFTQFQPLPFSPPWENSPLADRETYHLLLPQHIFLMLRASTH